ncbi:hypothetical protein GX51_01330 [Blastomyces parvus]|uniref:Uncharacterized protein n=1 Tax=Blastomyces parvus TaxID=2060905 RepID=A0A2B7XGB3_9EURO|nr:hypothetical protein GX51_01330 [Blastomyces parvus]
MSLDESLRNKNSPVAIVGAGISAQRGFTNVTIFDKQPYQKSKYSFEDSCDAANADPNKIIRVAYGDEKIYQDLTLEALKHWEEWNEQLA